MKFVITPTYQELFDNKPPELSELLRDIPSKAVLTLICSINSKLFLSRGKQTQFELFVDILQRQNEGIRKQILTKVISLQAKDPKQEIQFFTVLGSLEFIHYELINYRDLINDNPTPEQELNFLKAYFVIVQNINNNYDLVFGRSLEKGEFFHTATWPIFIEQVDTNHKSNPINALVRSLIFFNYFEKNSEYHKYLKRFLDFHERKNYWEYCKVLMDMLRINWESETKDKRFGHFAIKSTNEVNTFFENLSITIPEYQKLYSDGKRNFTGLKENPLIQFDDYHYLIINWNYITNKAFEGLVFDFYNHSGLKKDKIFKTLPDYKNFIAQEITEKFLLRKVLSFYLRKKYSVLKFDDQNDNGFPDAYYRVGKYIFLFEIKDAFFPAKAINSYDYEKIREAINLKYNNKSKGTGQLIKQIKYLEKESFEDESYQELNLKTRNLVIYPIIIYTDKYFGLPGINRYLNQEFKNNLENEKIGFELEKINDLLFMNVSFLINQIHNIDNFNLKIFLDKYFQKLHRSEKKFRKNQMEKDMQEMNMNFEEYISNKCSVNDKNPEYISKIFEIFEMRKHFA